MSNMQGGRAIFFILLFTKLRLQEERIVLIDEIEGKGWTRSSSDLRTAVMAL